MRAPGAKPRGIGAPIAGLPGTRKDAHRLGAPSIEEFSAAFSRHRRALLTQKPNKASAGEVDSL